MHTLKKALCEVSDSYDDFVRGVLAFVTKNPDNADAIMKYIEDNPDANTSEIAEFMIRLPGFFNKGLFMIIFFTGENL